MCHRGIEYHLSYLCGARKAYTVGKLARNFSPTETLTPNDFAQAHSIVIRRIIIYSLNHLSQILMQGMQIGMFSSSKD